MPISHPLSQLTAIFDRPVFIVAAPRSGSTMLFELMQSHRAVWTIGGEGHEHVESVEGLWVGRDGKSSNRLTIDDLSSERHHSLLENYFADLQDHTKRAFGRGSDNTTPIRFLEKTPKNALRVPFFKQAFPDAKFVWLVREPRGNISSIVDAWRSGRFVTYPSLPDWHTLPWSLVLIEEWQTLRNAPLGEIASRQWEDVNRTVLTDLRTLPREDWIMVSYERLLAARSDTIARILQFALLDPDAMPANATDAPLPQSRYTLSPPDREKWRKNEAEISPYLHSADTLMADIEEFAR